jgi:hypothetical protein
MCIYALIQIYKDLMCLISTQSVTGNSWRPGRSIWSRTAHIKACDLLRKTCDCLTKQKNQRPQFNVHLNPTAAGIYISHHVRGARNEEDAVTAVIRP